MLKMANGLEGFDELFEKMELLGSIGTRCGNKAVKKGAEVTLKGQKDKAPRDTTEGVNNLSTSKVNKYKSGDAYVSVGITDKNWEQCKGLYYQNFNGIHSNPENIGWMKEAFESTKDEATKVMQDVLTEEINRIF